MENVKFQHNPEGTIPLSGFLYIFVKGLTQNKKNTMKKLALTALVATWALLSHTTAWGQNFDVILNDGINISSLVGLEDVSPNAGLYSEIGVNYKFNDTFGVELGVAWSEQGAMSAIDDTFYTYEYDYLNLPLLATYNLPNNNITLFMGVQAGCFLIAKYTYEHPSVMGDGFVSGEGYFNSEEFHPWDFGATIGLRWLAIPELDLGFEVRYTHGITQTHNGVATSMKDYPIISVPNNRNSVFRIGMYITLW